LPEKKANPKDSLSHSIGSSDFGGQCYCDGGEVKNPDQHPFLGCAGRRFWIRFFDGRTITTNNLWCQGEIPEEFREELPDNAEFYTPEHIKFVNSLIGGGNY